jgi:hypothetical protein
MTDTPENQVTTEVDETKEEAEAERLFAEAAEAREGTQDDGSDDAGDDATAALKTDDADDQGEQPGPAKEPGTKEGAAVETPASGSGEFDWATADPAARAAHEAAQQQLDHKLKSANGRVSVLDRKLNELRQGGGSGEQEQPRKPLKELLAKETVDELVSEYPDLKPILDTLAEVASRVDGVASEVGEVKNAAVALATTPHEIALKQEVPNWAELARDDRFLGWVDDQPKKVRDAVSANWDGITNATEAAEVFKSFEQFIAPKQQEDAGGGEPSKRDRQQSGARAATVTAPTSAGGDSDDPEVIFAQAAAKKDRARGIRN